MPLQTVPSSLSFVVCPHLSHSKTSKTGAYSTTERRRRNNHLLPPRQPRPEPAHLVHHLLPPHNPTKVPSPNAPRFLQRWWANAPNAVTPHTPEMLVLNRTPASIAPSVVKQATLMPHALQNTAHLPRLLNPVQLQCRPNIQHNHHPLLHTLTHLTQWNLCLQGDPPAYSAPQRRVLPPYPSPHPRFQ